MKVDRSDHTLVIETPPGGFNGVSAFPLLFGGLFVALGVLCLVSAYTRSSGQSLAIAFPALLLGGWVGRIGVRQAVRRHRVELNRSGVRISWGVDELALAECPLRDLRVTLKRGHAWEVGLLPQWHRWNNEFLRLSVKCGDRQFFLLDGSPDRLKEQAYQIVQEWLRGQQS